MAYPSVHKLHVVHLNAHSPSIGASPVAAYLRVPFRCSIEKLTAVANGSITTADCSIAVALNGAAVSGSPFTLPVAGAGAGQVASMTPTAKSYANEDDTISFTPSGASGANIAGNFTASRLKAMGAVQYIGTGRLGASQDVAYGASSAASAAFGAQTYKVRLVATSDCRIRIGDGTPTAVATDTYLPALAAEYFTVTPGQKVAAIQVSSAGTLNVTEVS
jgi:hypothetical protein